MASTKDFFHWQVDPRAKPLSMDKDELVRMTEMLEFKYDRRLLEQTVPPSSPAHEMHELYHNGSFREVPPTLMTKLVSRLSYKPNAKVWVESGHTLVMVIDCPDREDPKRIVPVVSRQQIPASMAAGEDSENIMIDWVRTCLRQLEEHEMDEWLRLDGRLCNDPHRAEIRTDWRGLYK